MTSSERVRAILAGETPDRVPICDAYWQATLNRWHTEGLPLETSPDDYFGLEWCRITPDYSLQMKRRVIENSERHQLIIDANGVTQRCLRSADGWVPHCEGYTVQTRSEFEAHRQRFEFRESRLDGLEPTYQRAREQQRAVFFSAHGCFHGTWAKIGMDHQLLLMAGDAGFINELFSVHTQLVCDLFDGLLRRGFEFDGAFVPDDLGSTRSPLISPKMYVELVQPHHHRLCEHFAAAGLSTILHSDGNVAPLIPHFLDAGFRGLHPLECKAGLDAAELRQAYGERLVLFGNIDVRELAKSPAAAAAEVQRKVTAGKQGGGYLYHSDHSVPSNVPLENYLAALAAAREFGSY